MDLSASIAAAQQAKRQGGDRLAQDMAARQATRMIRDGFPIETAIKTGSALALRKWQKLKELQAIETEIKQNRIIYLPVRKNKRPC